MDRIIPNKEELLDILEEIKEEHRVNKEQTNDDEGRKKSDA